MLVGFSYTATSGNYWQRSSSTRRRCCIVTGCRLSTANHTVIYRLRRQQPMLIFIQRQCSAAATLVCRRTIASPWRDVPLGRGFVASSETARHSVNCVAICWQSWLQTWGPPLLLLCSCWYWWSFWRFHRRRFLQSTSVQQLPIYRPTIDCCILKAPRCMASVTSSYMCTERRNVLPAYRHNNIILGLLSLLLSVDCLNNATETRKRAIQYNTIQYNEGI